MDLGLAGKVALVTAASKGLGFAVAEGLVREGARVAISARDEAVLREAASRLGPEERVFNVAADLADIDDVDRMLDAVLEHYGRVDVLVCNTGGPHTTTFMEATLDDWDAALRLMLFPALRMVHRVVPGMRERQGGRIIFMTSSWVKQPRERGVLSTTVRSAISGLAKHLANELAADGILVHQVMPGPTWTDRSRQIVKRLAEARGVPVDTIKEEMIRELPLGRYGLPEEVAAAVLFLASEPAAFMTGTAVQVDGGQIRSTL